MTEMMLKPIPGFEDYYSISSTGTVISHARKVGNRRVKRIELKPKNNGFGYLSVKLCKDGISMRQYVHRLVAEAFLENTEGKCCVNHLDGNPRNNRVDNLEWATHPENMQHAYDTGLCKNQGGGHTFAVGVIDNTLGREFGSIKEWCAARGINYSTGRNLLNGSNRSRTIDLSGVVVTKKNKDND
jgi:hypothetical protein